MPNPAQSSRSRYALYLWITLVLPSLAAEPARAQGISPRDTTHVQKTFFVRRDAVIAAAGFAGSVALSAFDVRISHWWQQPSIQGGESRQDLVNNLTVFNEWPLLVGGSAAYLVGRVTHSATLTDVALHTTEAVALTVLASEAIRVPLGRARPRKSPDDQYVFEPGAGWNSFDYRAYPSIHAAVAFAAATAIAREVELRAPERSRYVGPTLYALATIPGFTRMYLNQHWASDIAFGTVIGIMFGRRVVSYAHSHDANRLDRLLLRTAVVPDGRGGAMMVVSLPTP